MFLDKPVKKTKLEKGPKPGLLSVMKAHQLLTKQRWGMIHRFEHLTGLENTHYQKLYVDLLNRFAEFVQLIPNSQSASLGSLLDESIFRALTALQLYREYSKSIDTLKIYAAFSAALLLELAKIVSQQRIIISNKRGHYLHEWSPFMGPMASHAEYYKLRMRKTEINTSFYQVNVLLARQVMPEIGFFWIAQNQKIFLKWLGALAGDFDAAGGFGHLLRRTQAKLKESLKPSVAFEPIPIVEVEPTPDVQLGEAFWDWLQHEAQLGHLNLVRVKEGVLLDLAVLIHQYVENDVTLKGREAEIETQFRALGLDQLDGQLPGEQEYQEKSSEKSQKEKFLSHEKPQGRSMSFLAEKPLVSAKDNAKYFLLRDSEILIRDVNSLVAGEYLQQIAGNQQKLSAENEKSLHDVTMRWEQILRFSKPFLMKI